MKYINTLFFPLFEIRKSFDLGKIDQNLSRFVCTKKSQIKSILAKCEYIWLNDNIRSDKYE